MAFLVLADTPEHSAVAESCSDHRWHCSTRHASGRPWVVHSPGARQPEQVFTAGGRRRLTLLGAAYVPDKPGLERALAEADGARELVAARRRAAGDFHLLVSTEDGTVQAGSISRSRRLASAQLADAVVFSDSAALLAELGGFSVDESLLAAWMLAPYPPHPLDDLPMWRGVDAVPPGQLAALDRAGALTRLTFWAPPAADVDMIDRAADLVQDALSRAVEARVRSYASVSSDLSGGLDSTSLTFVLDRHTSAFETCHSLSDDGLNDDARWAAAASGHLPSVRHHVLPYDGSPTWYTPVDDRTYSLDTPDPMARTQAKSLFLHLHSHSPRPHARLNGTGGDELFSMDVLGMHDYLRQDPAGAKGPFEAFVYGRHDLPRTVRRLMRRDPDRDTSFEDWFARLGATITAERRPWSLGWESTPRLAPWISAQAMSLLWRSFAGRADDAGHPEPISPRRSQHEIMKLVRVGGDVTRRMSALSSSHGVFVESPLLDEQVVDAALRATPSVLVGDGSYKPLLTAAVRGIVPPDIAERRSKGGYDRELYRGLDHNRAALLGLFDDDSRLAGRGLVDRDLVVRALSSLPTDAATFMELDATIGVELWLRDIEKPRHPSLQKELTTWATS